MFLFRNLWIIALLYVYIFLWCLFLFHSWWYLCYFSLWYFGRFDIFFLLWILCSNVPRTFFDDNEFFHAICLWTFRLLSYSLWIFRLNCYKYFMWIYFFVCFVCFQSLFVFVFPLINRLYEAYTVLKYRTFWTTWPVFLKYLFYLVRFSSEKENLIRLGFQFAFLNEFIVLF